MRPVDSHCHLQDRAFAEDREAVLERALEALEFLVVVGDDLETSTKAVHLCGDRVRAAAGFHPYHAERALVEMDALRALLKSPGVAAIGEIGLDYYNRYAPEETQKEAFRRQLSLAADLGLPVVIHSREADHDTAAILRDYAGDLAGCVMHCFAGDAAFAERCLEWGFHISFAGNVTFPKAAPLREAASVVPLDRLLVETDSPYLAPQPVRGKRCEPAYVRYTAETLAELKDVPFDDFARQTTQNARHVFKFEA